MPTIMHSQRQVFSAFGCEVDPHLFYFVAGVRRSSDSNAQRGKSSLFKSMFGILWKNGTPKSMDSDTSNGLPPPSPIFARQPSSPVSPPSPHSPFLGPPPRTPRTPTRKFTEDESHSAHSLRLGSPPGRLTQARRRVTADNYSPSLIPR